MTIGEMNKYQKQKEDAMYIVYEDEALAVVWKPRSMKTTREHANQKTSVEDESAKLLSPSAELDALPVAMACYALDAAVEGLVVMAKTVAAKSRCESANVSLRFQALVSGRVQLPVSELCSGREWHRRGPPNNDSQSRRQHRAKGLCLHYNTKVCFASKPGGDPLCCKWHRLHECAGCGGPHPFSACPESENIDVQNSAALAIEKAQDALLARPDAHSLGERVTAKTSMRLGSVTRCMGGDTYISAVELEPAHELHCSAVLCEQLLSAGHPIQPQDKMLKGRYTGVFLACTGVTIPAAAGFSDSALLLDVTAPARFERLLKKEAGFFDADRHLAEEAYEACGYPAPDWNNTDSTVPVQYQIGQALFCGRHFLVTPDVLIPRPCYEVIVKATLEQLQLQNDANSRQNAAILDLGCGSGCLLLACLAELPRSSGVGLDICPKALNVSKSNAERFNLTERCEWMQDDFNCLPEAFECLTDGFDAALVNPPYLERGAWLSSSCIAEPDLALFVNSKYDAYRAIEIGLRQCRSLGRPLLRQGAFLAIGLGSGHCKTVRDIYEEHGEFRLRKVFEDTAGIERCIMLEVV